MRPCKKRVPIVNPTGASVSHRRIFVLLYNSRKFQRNNAENFAFLKNQSNFQSADEDFFDTFESFITVGTNFALFARKEMLLKVREIKQKTKIARQLRKKIRRKPK